MSEPAEELHPVAEIIAQVAQDGPNDTLRFDREGISFIQKAIDEYIPAGEALMEAVDAVLCAAHLIETQRASKRAAQQLVAVVDRKQVIDAMVALNAAKDLERADKVAKSADKFAQFVDSEESRSAPGEAAAPEGSVKLGNLSFPKRL